MKNSQTIYVCGNCGEEYMKWQGRCETCGNWNTLKEFSVQSSSKQKSNNNDTSEITKLSDVKTNNFKRLEVGIYEVDRVLGGGLVPGSIILLAGEPGIGKSTLVMQVAGKVKNTLYISGEESIEQIKMRADRLKTKAENIEIMSETNITNIINTISKQKTQPNLIIIDSIQTMFCEDYPSTAGSIVQVRETALILQHYAKKNNIPIILIGHVTKDGTVAGPKTLEHMVDVVLNMEGERYHGMRLLRAQKNRFGETSEIGIFEIESSGLTEIKNPSKLFLGDTKSKTSGSAITVAMEGTRPILVEIQALTTPTVFGYPKRTSAGYDLNRLQLIIAILINRGGFALGSQDVYLNISGGYTLKEPSADLAVSLAIVSAYKNIVIKNKTVIFGELALSGDIRPVSFENKRIIEAKRLGFVNFIKSKNINQAVKEINNV
jgi:DNA repair protein RadA/Sms